MLSAVVMDKHTPETQTAFNESVSSFGDFDSSSSTRSIDVTSATHPPPTPPTIVKQCSMQTVFKGSVGCATTHTPRPKAEVKEKVVVKPTRATVCCAAVLMWLCCIDIENEQEE
jgi:hypothetical protein